MQVHYFSFITDQKTIEGIINKKVSLFVKKTTRFLGREFTFFIIGESHCVYAAGNTKNNTREEEVFFEIFSCLPLKESQTVDLLENKKYIFNHEFGGTRIKTEIHVKNMKKSDIQTIKVNQNRYDLFFKFPGEMSYTAIEIFKKHYETIHTYPELNKIVYTKTCFKEERNKKTQPV